MFLELWLLKVFRIIYNSKDKYYNQNVFKHASIIVAKQIKSFNKKKNYLTETIEKYYFKFNYKKNKLNKYKIKLNKN